MEELLTNCDGDHILLDGVTLVSQQISRYREIPALALPICDLGAIVHSSRYLHELIIPAGHCWGKLS